MAVIPAGGAGYKLLLVKATTREGCSATNEIAIYKTGPDILVPSAFTPNGHGKNDVLRPVLLASASSTSLPFITNTANLYLPHLRRGGAGTAASTLVDGPQEPLCT